MTITDNYPVEYMLQLSKGVLSPPDKQRANGTFDYLHSLYQAKNSGNKERYQAALDIVRAQLGTQRRKRYTLEALLELPPPKFLYKDEIIAGGLNFVIGKPGSCKSFYALDVALNVAQTDKVIYIAPEGLNNYADRILAWTKHNKKTAGQLELIHQPINLIDENDIADFITDLALDGIAPKLIVIDTLARSALGADENSSKDMGFVMEYCERIKEAFGCAVLVVHHTPKAGGSPRGSSAIEGAADMIISLDKDDDSITVSCYKAKYTAGFETRSIKLLQLDTRADQTSCVIVPSDKALTTDGDKLTSQQKALLDFMAYESFEDSGATYSAIKQGCPQITNIYRVLSTLKRRKFVTQDSKGDPWKITTAGLKEIGDPRRIIDLNTGKEV